MRSCRRLRVSVALACAILTTAGAQGALAQPTVVAVSPDLGAAAGGTSVRIEGSGFAPGASVAFGGARATGVQVISSTSLLALTPEGSGTVDVTVADSSGASAVSSHDWFAYEPAPGSPWLGLQGNSDGDKGPIDTFSRNAIPYDRSFSLVAGQLPSETEGNARGGTLLEDRLRYDHEYGMIPVASIQYRGYGRVLGPDPSFPRTQRTAGESAQGRSTIAEYLDGFLRSAEALLRLVADRYPGMALLLEPVNEPWAHTTPLYNGAEYADLLAQLLPAARAAGIPPADIYASAFGADQTIDPQGMVRDFTPGWVPAMYAAQPSLRSEIQGWYFHPYGPPSGSTFHDSWGIQSLPVVRRLMSSGQDNIIVSEIGYCLRAAGACNQSGAAEVETDAEGAARLEEMLANALAYHEAGWLRALIVYARGDGGWAMQESSGRVNRRGEALIAFAQTHRQGLADETCTSARLLGVQLALGPLGPVGVAGAASFPDASCDGEALLSGSPQPVL